MNTALRPLTTGELLDRTLRTYRKHFLLFLGISAVPSLVDLVLKLGLQISLGLGRRDTNPIVAVLAGLALLLVSFVFSAIITAGTTFAVSDLILERPTTIASCLNRVLPRVWQVIVTSFLYALIFGLGLLLLIIPGFYFLGKYGLSGPAVVLENIGPTEALSRSSDLTKESILRVLCIWFVAASLVLLVSWTLGIGVGVLAVTVLKGSGSTVLIGMQDVASALSTILVGPVMAIALTMLYYDQRVRKEAFDIENMMQLLERDNPPLAQGAAVS